MHQGILISNTLLGDAEDARLGIMLWEPLPYTNSREILLLYPLYRWRHSVVSFFKTTYTRSHTWAVVVMLGFKWRKSESHTPCLYLLLYLFFSLGSMPVAFCVGHIDWIVPNGDDCQWETLIWVFIGGYNWSVFHLGHKCSPKLGLKLERTQGLLYLLTERFSNFSMLQNHLEVLL